MQYIENQPVIVDAYNGPLQGVYVGIVTRRRAFAHDGEYLRVRITETAQGFTEGETIDALPERVTPAPVITDAELDEREQAHKSFDMGTAIAMAEDMARRPHMTLAEAERHYRR